MNLTFRELALQNRMRAIRWHKDFPNDGWTGADWSNAMCGEAGETANVVKKLRRIETGLAAAIDPPKEELLEKLKKEIGDTLIYLDLLAQYHKTTLEECATLAFNQVSEREGFPERIGE